MSEISQEGQSDNCNCGAKEVLQDALTHLKHATGGILPGHPQMNDASRFLAGLEFKLNKLK